MSILLSYSDTHVVDVRAQRAHADNLLSEKDKPGKELKVDIKCSTDEAVERGNFYLLWKADAFKSPVLRTITSLALTDDCKHILSTSSSKEFIVWSTETNLRIEKRDL